MLLLDEGKLQNRLSEAGKSTLEVSAFWFSWKRSRIKIPVTVKYIDPKYYALQTLLNSLKSAPSTGECRASRFDHFNFKLSEAIRQQKIPDCSHTILDIRRRRETNVTPLLSKIEAWPNTSWASRVTNWYSNTRLNRVTKPSRISPLPQ